MTGTVTSFPNTPAGMLLTHLLPMLPLSPCHCRPDTASADAALHMFVAEVSSKPGGFSLLEKKLVTWENRDNELPADGERC